MKTPKNKTTRTARVGSREFVRQFAASMADDLRYWQGEAEKYPRATHGRREAEAHSSQLSRLLSKIPKAYLPNAGDVPRAGNGATPEDSPMNNKKDARPRCALARGWASVRRAAYT